MASAAQTLANRENAKLSTGPVTDAGRKRSSRNALTLGLFTMNDFVRADETDQYEAIATSLWAELSPATTLEQTFVAEIISATWRLRRCTALEGELIFQSILDPIAGDCPTAASLKSIDRARAQANNILRRSTAELRRLQTDRIIRAEIFVEPGMEEPTDSGLTSYKEVTKTLNENDRGKLLARKLRGTESFQDLLDRALGAPGTPVPGTSAQSASFCNNAQSPAANRNAA